MIPTEFAYHRASSVSEALKMLQTHGDDAQLLAGGHSLIPAMKLRLNTAEHLIDISKIEALRSISEDGGDIVIGAGCTHYEIMTHDLITTHLPVMAETGAVIGDIQVRNAGTIGGSIAHADPAADWPAALLAADARVELQSTTGTRSVSASDFFVGFYETALEEGEIVTAVRIPKPGANSRSTYVKFMQPASRFAIVGCAVMLDLNGGTAENVRVAFNGVSDSAFRDSGVEGAMNGQGAGAISGAASKAADGMDLLSDHYASEEYRKHLATVFAERALTAAMS